MGISIRVGNLRREKVGVKVDRSTVMGNPFEMGKDESLRDPVCEAHQDYLGQVLAGSEPVQVAVEIANQRKLSISKSWIKPSRLQFMTALGEAEAQIKENPNQPILCWCADKRCHGDAYARYFEQSLSQTVTAQQPTSALLHWQQSQPNHKVMRGDMVVVSGGQSGADKGGLLAGRALGIKTGGYAPHLWLVENGNDPTLRQFGLIEAQTGRNTGHSYMIRTRLNAEQSDGTVVFGSIDPQQDKGSYNTIELAKELNKPYFHAETRELLDDSVQQTADELRQWVLDNSVQVLNVAGNRGSKDTRLEGLVERVLKVALREPVRENLPQVVLSEDRISLSREPLDPRLKTIQYRVLIDPSDKLARVDDVKLFGAIDALVNRAFERAVEQGLEQIEFVLDSEHDSPSWVVKAIAQRGHQASIKVGVHVGAETRAKRDQSITIALTTGDCVAINLTIASSIAAKEFVVVYDTSTEQYKSFNAPDAGKPKTPVRKRVEAER